MKAPQLRILKRKAPWSGGRWCCDGCGHWGNWGPGWAYYGTYDHPEIITCSDTCREKIHKERGIRPTFLPQEF